MKKFAAAAAVVLIAAAAFFGIKAAVSENGGEKVGTVTVSINCEAALEYKDIAPELAETLPKDGLILPPTKVDLKEGESAYDIISRAAKKNKLQIEFSGGAKTKNAYVKGIAGLYEFSCGGSSGWGYTVDGEFPEVGCSLYYPTDGQRIEFVYFC